jgi:hypothetical protein
VTDNSVANRLTSSLDELRMQAIALRFCSDSRSKVCSNLDSTGLTLPSAWLPRNLPERETVDLHSKIDQMLTEPRVNLRGVQVMIAFQQIGVGCVARLRQDFQRLHMIYLALAASRIALLLTAAAIHRIAFAREDDLRFHTIRNRLVAAALVPLALGISRDLHWNVEALREPIAAEWRGCIRVADTAGDVVSAFRQVART